MKIKTLTKMPPRKSYPLNQSPLFKLGSKSRLAAQFNYKEQDLQDLADKGDKNYFWFKVEEGTDKERKVQEPKPILERIHRRVFTLLQRIQPPEYLHSGLRGRSYLTNAEAHLGNHPLVKLDIKSFYPSTNGGHVFGCFRDLFEMPDDVAGLLTALLTAGNQVPTGSCVSQLLAFYAHYPMFEKISGFCNERELNMSCYVDDITISGPDADKHVIRKVGQIIEERGLQYHKTAAYPANAPKEVTGVILRGNYLLVRNRKQKGIVDALSTLRSGEVENPEAMAMSILGRSTEAAQIEKRFGAFVTEARGLLKKARRV